MLRRRNRADSTPSRQVVRDDCYRAGEGSKGSEGLWSVHAGRPTSRLKQGRSTEPRLFTRGPPRVDAPFPLNQSCELHGGPRNTPEGAGQTFASYLFQSSLLLLVQFPLWQILV